MDATQFCYHYYDRQKEMRELAEGLESFYAQILKIIADSPAEAVLWGAKYDNMITHPASFEKEIVQQVSMYMPDTLGFSALLTTAMPDMRDVIEALNFEVLRESLRLEFEVISRPYLGVIPQKNGRLSQNSGIPVHK